MYERAEPGLSAMARVNAVTARRAFEWSFAIQKSPAL
jgi:hypothetical protein